MSERYGVGSYRRYLQGDERGLEELVTEYGDALVRFAYCIARDFAAAEDIVQDAFATLMFKRKRFSNDDNFRAYLYKMVRNKGIDYLRVQSKTASLNDLQNVLVGNNFETDILLREQNATLYCCMQRLSPQYAQVLYLVYLEGCKIEQAAKIMQKNKKQAYNLLARAKASLKELLRREGIFQ